jgi:TolB protein
MTHRISLGRAIPLAISLLVAFLVAAPPPPAGAAFPGPNGRISFNDVINGQIYTVNPDGSALIQVTDMPRRAVAFDQVWSADSEHIAFAANQTGNFEIYVMDPDGGNVRQITRSPHFDEFWTAWFPGGRKLAFVRCRPTDPGGCAVFTIRTDGTHLRQLTPLRNDVFDARVDVAPDGAHLAFTRFQGRGLIAQVLVMNTDGSDAHHVTPARLEALGPDWSPDGERLIFHNACCKPHSSIFVSAADGSDLTRLTHPPYQHNDILPVFSPDGERIAFGSDRAYDDFCCSDLIVADANGRQRVAITPRGTGAEEPDWGSAPLVEGGPTLAALPSMERAAQRAGRSSVNPRACLGLVELTFLPGGCPLRR